MRKFLHIILVAAVAVSCLGPRVIPRDKLAQIYYDMFMADQQLREIPSLRQQADTMLVYEAVFNRYGYDTDDYLHSVRYYLKDPERSPRPWKRSPSACRVRRMPLKRSSNRSIG